MAKRTNFIVSLSEAAASQPAPHAVVAAISIDLQVAWPAAMGHEDAVRASLTEAYEKALVEIGARTIETELARAA